MDILPGPEQVILLEHSLDLVFAKPLADGAAMFVVDHAARLIQHLPASLPGHVSQVGILQVEGRQQFVEAAELQELAAIEGAGTAAAGPSAAAIR